MDNLVLVQESPERIVIRRREYGPIVAVFTRLHDAVAFMREAQY